MHALGISDPHPTHVSQVSDAYFRDSQGYLWDVLGYLRMSVGYQNEFHSHLGISRAPPGISQDYLRKSRAYFEIFGDISGISSGYLWISRDLSGISQEFFEDVLGYLEDISGLA